MTCVQCYGKCSILERFWHSWWIGGDTIIPSVLFSTRGDITSMSGLLSVYLGMFSFVEGYPHYLGIIISAKGAYYNGGKIDHKLQHSIDDIITVLMISFCSTDDIIHLSLLLWSILPMEVLLHFQDGVSWSLGIWNQYKVRLFGLTFRIYWVENLKQIKLFGA